MALNACEMYPMAVKSLFFPKNRFAAGNTFELHKFTRRQRWSRGHKARGQGQGHKKNPRLRPRPRTAFSRTDTLEAKDRKARGQGKDQGHKRKCSPKKKKGLHKNFLSDLQKKRSSQKFFKRSPQKNVFQKNFQALHKILTIQKILLSSSRGQANFRGLEASRPRPRTSKCVLEAKDILEDSTSARRVSRFRHFCYLALGLNPTPIAKS